MRLTTYVRCIALAALMAACASNEPSTFDPAQVNLTSGTWDAHLAVAVSDPATATPLTCTTSWTTAFDTSVYVSRDTTYVHVPDSVSAICPGFPDRLWFYSGMSLFATRSADTVILRTTKSPDTYYAKLIILSDTRLEGAVDPYYSPRGPLELIR